MSLTFGFIPQLVFLVGGGVFILIFVIVHRTIRFLSGDHPIMTTMSRIMKPVLATAACFMLASLAVAQWQWHQHKNAQVAALATIADRLDRNGMIEPGTAPLLHIPEWLADEVDARSAIEALSGARGSDPMDGTTLLPDGDRSPDDPSGLAERDLNRALLHRAVAEHGFGDDDRSERIASIEFRLATLGDDTSPCPTHRFGSGEPHVEDLAFLQEAVRRLQDTTDPLVASAMSLAIENRIEERRLALAAVRAMPVINGEARGTLPPAGTLVRFCEPRKPMPATSTVFRRKGGSATFALVTKADSMPLLARLILDDEDVWRGFVQPGESIQTELPPGDYTLRYARGSDWYGFEYLFGPGTRFTEAGDVVDLRVGYLTTIELIPQVGGNLSEDQIDANAF